jgi:Fic family protein
MRFIHADPDWPNFLWNAEALSTPLAAVRHRQGLLLGRMGTFPRELRAEASTTTLASDATGMAELMLDATRHHTKPLTKQRLFGWHASLFPTGHVGMQRITAGAWRTSGSEPVRGVSEPAGRERAQFVAPAADRIESEMATFLEWFNGTPTIDPVLMAGTAHLWFVTLEPFEAGNDQIASAITEMALARADGTHERFYSMSTRIARERTAYDKQLSAAQRRDLDISPWLEWFIGCLDRAISDADNTMAPVLQRADLWKRAHQRALNDRQRMVLERMSGSQEDVLTNAKYAKLAKCSPDSALRDMREMLEWGLLRRTAGGGRSTSYRVA